MIQSWRELESELIEAVRKQGHKIVEKGLGERALVPSEMWLELARRDLRQVENI
jgi:hypothetical protein